MPFFDAAFPLFGQLPKYRTAMSLQVAIQRLPAVFWYDNDVIFSLPLCVILALELVHRGFTLGVLGGSQKQKSRWTPVKVKLLRPPRESRGESLVCLEVNT